MQVRSLFQCFDAHWSGAEHTGIHTWGKRPPLTGKLVAGLKCVSNPVEVWLENAEESPQSNQILSIVWQYHDGWKAVRYHHINQEYQTMRRGKLQIRWSKARTVTGQKHIIFRNYWELMSRVRGKEKGRPTTINTNSYGLEESRLTPWSGETCHQHVNNVGFHYHVYVGRRPVPFSRRPWIWVYWTGRHGSCTCLELMRRILWVSCSAYFKFYLQILHPGTELWFWWLPVNVL